MEVEFVSDGGIVEIGEDVIRGDVEDEAVGVCVKQCGAGESELEGAEDVLHADLGVLQDGDPYVDGLIEQDWRVRPRAYPTRLSLRTLQFL